VLVRIAFDAAPEADALEAITRGIHLEGFHLLARAAGPAARSGEVSPADPPDAPPAGCRIDALYLGPTAGSDADAFPATPGFRRRLHELEQRLSGMATAGGHAAPRLRVEPDPGVEADLRPGIERLVAGFATPFPVVRSIESSGSRAKLDLVRFGDGAAVCKVFKPGYEEYFRREVEVLRACADSRFVPELLAVGESWLVIPYYRGPSLRQRIGWTGLLPLRDAREAMQALRDLYDRGIAHMDFHPGNILVDPEQGLKVIDFETAHRYDVRPARFEESFDIAGPPAHASRRKNPAPTYERRWRPLVGLELRALLHGTPRSQRIRRLAFAIGLQADRLSRLSRLPARLRKLLARPAEAARS
jgi:hypothetical protein